MKTIIKASLAGLIAASAFALPALAQSSDSIVTRSVDVYYGDLDLTTQAGEAKLDQRIRGAARSICRALEGGGHYSTIAACHSRTLAGATSRRDAVVLAARQAQNLELASK